MVHVPFFNIDLPEPRLGALLPDSISAVVQITGKALEYGHDLLYPPSQEDLAAFNKEFEDDIPREFDRVRKRYAEGKILNDEQLSSELEDASFDWYRRQLRTSVLGATDEEMEDVAARKLGLSKPSLQEAVMEQHLAASIAAAGGVDVEEEVRNAQGHQAILLLEAEQRSLLAARQKRIAELRRQVRPPSRQAVSTVTNASGGMLLGVLLFKSALMVTRGLFGRRKPRQRPQAQRPAPQRPSAAALQQQQQQQSRQQAAAAAAAAQQAAVAASRTQAAAQRQPQAQVQEKGSKAQSSQAAAATQGDAAATTRKPRAVKKR